MKPSYPLLFLCLTIVILLPSLAFTIINASNAQTIQVIIETQGTLEVKTFGSLTLNISKVYDSATIYLSLHNVGSEAVEVFWRHDLNSSVFAVEAIWYMTTDWLIWRHGNIWRYYNGSYWAESGGWFKQIPTAGWRHWRQNMGIWIKANSWLNGHFTVNIVQPPETLPATFTLTFYG